MHDVHACIGIMQRCGAGKAITAAGNMSVRVATCASSDPVQAGIANQS